MRKSNEEYRTRYVDTPAGVLTLELDGVALHAIHFGIYGERKPEDGSAVLLRAERELREYFDGRRKTFEVPLLPAGTPFQLRVWEALRKIPYGETRTYGEIARSIGAPGAARAVGMACNRNPIALMIPCHRVIGGDGSLTGFAAGIEIKRMLLEMEKRYGEV